MTCLNLNRSWLSLVILASATATACSSASNSDEYGSSEGASRFGWGMLQTCGIDELVACPINQGDLDPALAKIFTDKGFSIDGAYTNFDFPDAQISITLTHVTQTPCSASTDFGVHCAEQPAILPSEVFAFNVYREDYKNIQGFALNPDTLLPLNQNNPDFYGTVELPPLTVAAEEAPQGYVTKQDGCYATSETSIDICARNLTDVARQMSGIFSSMGLESTRTGNAFSAVPPLAPNGKITVDLDNKIIRAEVKISPKPCSDIGDGDKKPAADSNGWNLIARFFRLLASAVKSLIKGLGSLCGGGTA